MSEESTVCTIASVQFNGVYLQMDGYGVKQTWDGMGYLGIGHGAGPNDQFRISPKPTDGSPHVTGLESVAYPGVFMRMDATGVSSLHHTGGLVNKQLGQFDYEKFIIQYQSDGTVFIESQSFRGVFLRLSMGVSPGETGPVVNCHFGASPFEKFRLGTPPATTRLRVLTYNTHLMQHSFLETATDRARDIGVSAYAVFEDEARRDIIIRNSINALPDIICFQEVWAQSWMQHFRAAIHHLYPYSMVGDVSQIEIFFQIIIEATSGLVLFSKYPLSDRFFERFPDMEGLDDWSEKGALCAIADIPNVGRLRLGTGHTTGETRDIQFLVNNTLMGSWYQDLPALMMGDFNIGWRKGEGNTKYNEMKTIFSFPGTGLKPATDSWLDVYSEKSTENPYTVKMCDNKLHQIFSPERDTEPDTRLDYLWVKSGVAQAWKPVAAKVPRGADWMYTSRHWEWGHKNTAYRMPSAASIGDRLVVVSRSHGKLGDNVPLLSAVYDRRYLQWKHYTANFTTSAPPGIVAINKTFHLFYRHGEGNAIFHRSSGIGYAWTPWVSTGLETGGCVCPIMFRGKLHLLFVDWGDGAKSYGGMVFCSFKTTDDDTNWGPGNWSPPCGIGITTRSDISAAVFDNKLYVFAKENGPADDSSAFFWSRLDEPGTTAWQHSRFFDLLTSGSPGVVVKDNLMHLYYRHNEGDKIFHASTDGKELKERDQPTEYHHMKGGVCPVLFNNKLWLFYPNEGMNYYHDQTMVSTQLYENQVDISDHYPLLVDLEARTIFVNIVVDIIGVGERMFDDGEWAGTRGETRSLDKFRLTSQMPNVDLTYNARMDGHDSDWVSDGQDVGVSGKGFQGFTINLEGDDASLYELKYKAHVSFEGDIPEVGEGKYCGTTHLDRAVEAIWIQIRRK
jgi:endonuclease/exonuclease/phosphatase family metal-dependent hydrolase